MRASNWQRLRTLRAKNADHCIKFNELLIRNASDMFTIDAKHWYEKSDANDLRIQKINFVCEATRRSILEGTRVGRKNRQRRKLVNHLTSKIALKK